MKPSYIIKVYAKMPSPEELRYVQTLPYNFYVIPTNICNQLNEMLGENFVHIISIREAVE